MSPFFGSFSLFSSEYIDIQIPFFSTKRFFRRQNQWHNRSYSVGNASFAQMMMCRLLPKMILDFNPDFDFFLFSCCLAVITMAAHLINSMFIVIDCGIPLDTRNGRYLLLNATTTYQSMVKYSCHENYTLIGNETRNCTEHATWSGLEPSCKCESPFSFKLFSFRLLIQLNYHLLKFEMKSISL